LVGVAEMLEFTAALVVDDGALDKVDAGIELAPPWACTKQDSCSKSSTKGRAN
jgi:hypothetical protein